MGSKQFKNTSKIPENNRRLSRRERQVLELLGQGKSSKEIADVLNITVATVESHRKHLRQKRDLHSTAELVAYAAQNLRKDKH
jgi:DNA-binding CsgD family transcriptional regulator